MSTVNALQEARDAAQLAADYWLSYESGIVVDKESAQEAEHSMFKWATLAQAEAAERSAEVAEKTRRLLDIHAAFLERQAEAAERQADAAEDANDYQFRIAAARERQAAAAEKANELAERAADPFGTWQKVDDELKAAQAEIARLTAELEAERAANFPRLKECAELLDETQAALWGLYRYTTGGAYSHDNRNSVLEAAVEWGNKAQAYTTKVLNG
jgi:hypothetical protein